jgi:hypothetical protein
MLRSAGSVYEAKAKTLIASIKSGTIWRRVAGDDGFGDLFLRPIDNMAREARNEATISAIRVSEE